MLVSLGREQERLLLNVIEQRANTSAAESVNGSVSSTTSNANAPYVSELKESHNANVHAP